MTRQKNGQGQTGIRVNARGSFALQTQSGAALVTALVMLLVLTVVGVSSLGTTVLEERMARNSREYQLALQAAEAALRAGERQIQNDSGNIVYAICNSGGTDVCYTETDPNPGDQCPNGLCTPKEHDPSYIAGYTKDRWEDPYLDVWNIDGKHIEYPYKDDLDLATEPQYIIEFMGYRIPSAEEGGSSPNCVDPSAIPPVTDPAYLKDPYNKWPYCSFDPPLFRITALATTTVPGSKRGGAKVMLQSTYLQ